MALFFYENEYLQLILTLNFNMVNSETPLSWSQIYTISAQQNIAALAWDNIQQAMTDGKISTQQQPTKAQKIQWAMAAEHVEQKYARQRNVIEKLAKFFAERNIKLMILKGYGLSLNYPVPNHRPCSDVDIWLFEERQMPDGTTKRHSAQQKADKLLREQLNISIDEDEDDTDETFEEFPDIP